MASLGTKTSSGELSWDKYVLRNKNWKELELVIETDTSLFKKDGRAVKELISLAAGTPLKLKSEKCIIVGVKKYAVATVNIKGKKTDGIILITAIRKPTNFNPTGYEVEVVNAINKIIKTNNNAPIDIKIKGTSKVYKGITGAIQVDTTIKRLGGVTADPKADIILYVDKKNLLSPNNIYISHKKEGGPEAFQQYGGLSEKSSERIYNHPETKKFLKAVAANIGKNGLKNPMFMAVSDGVLKNKAIYGPDYGSKFGLQHVNLIGQGLPKIEFDKKGIAVLDFTSHMSVSGNLSHFIEGYTPVFGATFRAGRGFVLDGKTYSGARVGIYPMKLISSRTGAVEIK